MDKVVIPPLALMAAEDVQRKGGTMYEALVAALAAWPQADVWEAPFAYNAPHGVLYIVLPLTTQEKDNG